MIYREKSHFREAVWVFTKDAIQDRASHKDTATFQIGDVRKGFYLVANNRGWVLLLEGVIVHKQERLAAPLSNLQAACVVIDA